MTLYTGQSSVWINPQNENERYVLLHGNANGIIQGDYLYKMAFEPCGKIQNSDTFTVIINNTQYVRDESNFDENSFSLSDGTIYNGMYTIYRNEETGDYVYYLGNSFTAPQNSIVYSPNIYPYLLLDNNFDAPEDNILQTEYGDFYLQSDYSLRAYNIQELTSLDSSIHDKLVYIKETQESLRQLLIDNGETIDNNTMFKHYINKLNNIIDGYQQEINDKQAEIDNSQLPEAIKGYYIDYNNWVASDTSLQNKNVEILNFYNLTTIEETYFFRYILKNNQYIKTVYLQELTEINGMGGMDCAFSGSKVSFVSMPNLTTVSSFGLREAFKNSLITSLDISNLTNVLDNALNGMCYGCNNLVTVQQNLPKVFTEMFRGTGLRVFDASSATTIYKKAFYDCKHLFKIWIPSTCTSVGNGISAYTDSPFFKCSSYLTIYTDAPSRLSGWINYCFLIDRTTEATIVYGATHEDFLNAPV